MSVTINNYTDLQNVLSALVANNQLQIGQAPHGAFWDGLSYEDFITGNVPHITNPVAPHGPYKYVEPGNAANSTIFQALSGATGTVFDPSFGDFGQMPQPSAPYDSTPPLQSDIIAALEVWINNGCPNDSSEATDGEACSS